jgi:hypothetical protein
MFFIFSAIFTYAFYLIMVSFGVNTLLWVHYFMFFIMITILSIFLPVPVFSEKMFK